MSSCSEATEGSGLAGHFHSSEWEMLYHSHLQDAPATLEGLSACLWTDY